MSEWHWPATRVARIVDGDTIDATVTRDIGFEGVVSFPVRLRLNRINAPRSSSAAGRATKARVAALIGSATVHVITVKGYKYGAPADKAGEYMAEVILPAGENVSDVLVREGLAVYWDGTGPRPADG